MVLPAMPGDVPQGLRERKKRATHDAIAAAAHIALISENATSTRVVATNSNSPPCQLSETPCAGRSVGNVR